MRSARFFTMVVVLLVLTCALYSCAVAQEQASTLAHAADETLSRAAVAEPSAEQGQESGQATARQPNPDPLLDSAKLVPLRAVERSLKGFVDFLLPAALTLAGVGILVMAIIQLLKDLIPTRRWLQRVWFRKYIERTSVSARRPTGKPDVSARIDDTSGLVTSLVALAAAGDSDALFGLPIEKLTGQLSAAAQSVLDDPVTHEALLRVLAAHATESDLEEVLRPDEPSDQKALKRLVDARSRVFAQIQRQLDAVQLSMGHRWTTLLKRLSVGLGAAFIFLSVWRFVPAALSTFHGVLIWALLALVGGFVAPVARDLVAALQSIRSARS